MGRLPRIDGDIGWKLASTQPYLVCFGMPQYAAIEISGSLLMQFRAFSSENESLPVIGLGCSRIGSFNNPAPIAQVRRTLEVAIDRGVTLLDTADIYGQGDSEREIGRFLRRRSERAFVVTKVGKQFSLKMRLLMPLKPLLKPLLSGRGKVVTSRREANVAHDFSSRHILAAVEGSLRRLTVERLDGLLLHSPPPEALLHEHIGETLNRLKADGKVRHIGISCDDLASLDAALGIDGISLLELPLDVIEAARASTRMARIHERKIGILAREVIRLRPTLKPSEAVAQAACSTDITSVIVGTTNPNHLVDLIDATERSLSLLVHSDGAER